MDSVDPSAILGSTLVDPTGTHAVVLNSLIGSGSFAHVYLAEEVPQPEPVAAASSAATTAAASTPAPSLRPRSPHAGVPGASNQQHHHSPRTLEKRRAVKRLFKTGLDARQLVLQRQEAELMKAIEPHQNIIRLLATVEDDECLYLIMEYCELDLYEAITQQGGFPDDVVKEVFGQIADAVMHCHASGIYHRDLKPENCLISADYKVKLADFGLATTDPWSTEMGCGSVRYMAPECFDPLHHVPEDHGPSRPPPEVFGYSPPANDVWALGVILINLLFGKNPWFEAHKTDAIFSAYCSSNPNILRQQFNLSPQFDAVLRRAFELDPVRRCSVADLKHMVEATTTFVGTPAPSPSPTPPFFAYAKESILGGPGLVVPAGHSVKLPMNLKRYGLAGMLAAEVKPSLPPPPDAKRQSQEWSKRTSVLLEPEASSTGADPDRAKEPSFNRPLQSPSFSMDDSDDLEDDDRAAAEDIRERMSSGMAERMFDSDPELAEDGEHMEVETSIPISTVESAEAVQSPSERRSRRLSFAPAEPEVADSDSPLPAITEEQATDDLQAPANIPAAPVAEPMAVDKASSASRSAEVTANATPTSSPATSSETLTEDLAANGTPPAPASLTGSSSAATTGANPVDTPSSRSRDSGFESAVGTPSRNNTVPARIAHSISAASPRALMKPTPDPLSAQARLSSDLGGAGPSRPSQNASVVVDSSVQDSAKRDGELAKLPSSEQANEPAVRSLPRHSEHETARPGSEASPSNENGSMRRSSQVASSEIPGSIVIPAALLGMIGRVSVDQTTPENASIELPSATRRIFRTSKLFKFGKSRTPQPPEEQPEEHPHHDSSSSLKVPRGASPSSKGWFSVQMVRESPGRPANSSGETRQTGVIGLLGLRRNKASNESFDLTPESAPAALDRSFFRRPSWRAPSPFGASGRKTPVGGGRRESGSSIDTLSSSGNPENPAPSDGSSSSRDPPLRRLRSALSVASLKKTWRTIRQRSGLAPSTSPTPPSSSDYFARHSLPPRPASANDVHPISPNPAPGTHRRMPGWRRPGGKDLITGDLFNPAATASVSSPLAGGAASSSSSSSSSSAHRSSPRPSTSGPPLFAEATSSIASSSQQGASQEALRDSERGREGPFRPMAIALSASKGMRNRSTSAPPAM